MKRLLFALVLITLMSFQAWAGCPYSEPVGCPNQTIDMDGNIISGDVTFSGTITTSGTDERIQGADSFIDLNDGGTGVIRSGSLDAESLDYDYETTANTVDVSSATGVTDLDINNITLELANSTTVAGKSYLYNNVTNNVTTETTAMGINNDILHTGGDGDNLYSMFNRLYLRGDDSNADSWINMYSIYNDITFRASTNSADEYTITNVYGVRQLITLQTGNLADHTMTTYKGFSTEWADVDDNTLGGTDWYEVYLDTVPDFGGTLTNNYGVFVGSRTYGTNKYGIVLDEGSDCVWMEGVTGTATCSETIQLTATNINDLETTAITLASARAGAILEFKSAMLIWDYTANHDCTNADNKFRVRYNNGAGQIVSEAIDMNTFLENSADAIRWMDKSATTDTDLLGNVNQALVLDNEGTGDCTGGAGSTLDVKINYNVHITGL